jgi:hypothetical protein
MLNVNTAPGFLRWHRALTTRSGCIARCGVLTARHVRDIRSPLSWCRASAGTGHEAQLPENPANMGLLGQKDLLINGLVWCLLTTVGASLNGY